MKSKTWIPYGRQCIDDEDLLSIKEVLNSTNLTQGPKISEFEEALRRETDARFAVCVNSGTSALHIACLAAGVGPGDEVITTPNTFVASANCAVYCGARPVFADIDPDTYNMAPTAVEKKITARTRAVIPVHFAGQSCDMEAIQQIKADAEEKHGRKIFIIEDACHALGSLYKDKKTGSCSFSDMTVMSFHPVKHITTGEGGVVFTNNEELLTKLRLLRSHGITSDPEAYLNHDLAFQSGNPNTCSEVNPWYYEQVAIGFNYRITDIQCALGLSQLKKLSRFRARRREIVNQYNRAFSNADCIRIPFEAKDCRSNFHLYVPLFDFDKMGISRARFMEKLKDRGIQTQVHYIPVHFHSYYRRQFGTGPGDCPNAEDYYRQCLSLPLHPSMNDMDVNRVLMVIGNILIT
jgi:UDP-4-amino-4,6-dideoxy-N-acetyl-beta-L-altrosamine transaminase